MVDWHSSVGIKKCVELAVSVASSRWQPGYSAEALSSSYQEGASKNTQHAKPSLKATSLLFQLFHFLTLLL